MATHQEAAVAGKDNDRRVGVGGDGAEGGGQAGAECAAHRVGEAAGAPGVQVEHAPVGLDGHVGDHQRVVGEGRVELVHQLALGGEAVGGHLRLAAGQRGTGCGGAVAGAGGDAGLEQGVAEAADVGDDTLGNRVVAADAGRVEVDLDERARDLDRPVAGGLLREAGAEGDADVAGGDQAADGGLLAGGSGVQRVAGRQHALAVEAGDDGRVQRLGQLGDAAGVQAGAAAGEDERRLSAVQQLSHASDGGRVGRRRGQARDRDLGRLGGGGQHRRHRLDHGRAGPGGDRAQRLVDRGGQRGGGARPQVMAGDGMEGAGLADGLVHPAALAGVARHLGGDVQDAQVGGVGLAHAGEGVEGAGAGAGDADADAVGGARVADGGEGGGLLVADDDRSDRGAAEGLPQAERVLAGDAEDDLDAVRLERGHQRVGAGAHAGCLGGAHGIT